jgi:hypothetical protein
MSNTCQLKINTNFKPSLWEWCGMLTGFTYVKTAVFKDGSEVAINITADDFELAIFNSAGAPVTTLVLGVGLSIVAPDKLNIAVGPPTTTAPGQYTGLLVWTRVSSGAVIPIINFTFLVE